MKVSSTEFDNQGRIPPKFTCDGEGVNPALEISEVPGSAESLALVVDDPDAPGGTFVHWVMWNIEPSVGSVAEGGAPAGAVQGSNSAGETGYFHPCPPSGTHRYFFKMFALDSGLDLSEGASVDELYRTMEGHVLEESQLVGLYSRT